MVSYFPQEDRLFVVTMLLAVWLAVANAVFSTYGVDQFSVYYYDVPFSVAYQAIYPGVIFLVIVPVCLFMRSSRPWRTIIAGTILGLVGAVFVNDFLDTFFPNLWLGDDPASILAMLVTACVLPMGVTSLEIWRQSPTKAPS